jgi:urea carboxylase-associated protein 2
LAGSHDVTDIPLDQQTPEQHRRRYEALRTQAQARATPDLPCPAIAADRVLHREIIPGGWYWSAVIPRGRTLRVVNTAGSSSVSALLWNAHETSERFNAADTVKVQWTVNVGAGLLLLSDMGRALASITGDSGARHDMLTGGSTAASNARRYGPGVWRNTRDNFLLAAGKHGLDRRDIPPCLTLFADIRTDAAEQLAWHGTGAPGAAVDLRAEMDVLVALSNCPHPLDPRPGYAPLPVEAVIWDAGPVAADDPCRSAGPEAIRAFENNRRMLHG